MDVYLIENLVNGMRYVGKTTQTARERWREHRTEALSRRCEPYDLQRRYADEAEPGEVEVTHAALYGLSVLLCWSCKSQSAYPGGNG
jgi:hypothetical protein